MAITETIESKEFVAGAPDIILKGDLTPKKPEIKMASDDMNERFLEQLYEQLLDEGFSPEEAAKKARQLAEERSMADGGRAQYGLGSIVKGVKKAVKGVAKGVKNVVSSDMGKLALTALAANYAPMLFGKQTLMQQGLPSIFSNVGSFFTGGSEAMNALKIGGAGAIITGLLAQKEQKQGESDIDFSNRLAEVKDQLNVQFKRLYPQNDGEGDEEYNIRISAMVEEADDSTIPAGEMAEGGRVGRAFGSDKLVEQASGIEGIPINMNSKGVKELDMRETGGFIPPVGVKEKADDIPAMLSNNEFVFTADAVRAAGGGSVNKGAQIMYDTMKKLESKVV